jgi:MscS family membrane protein
MKLLSSEQRTTIFVYCCVLLAGVTLSPAQALKPALKTPPDQPAPEQQQDPLGRDTPRGSVLGFLTLCRSGNFEAAAQYMNTRQSGQNAATLAGQLYFVLDRRLPAKLNNLSNEPEGSLSDPLDPRREIVGSVVTTGRKVDIYVERIDRGKAPPIWLFSRQTLAAIPDLYEEINAVAVENVLPEVLLRQFLGVTLFGWLFVFILLPALYFCIGISGRLIGLSLSYVYRRIRQRPVSMKNPFPHPVRMLLIAIFIRWTLSEYSLSLLTRQVWSTIATLVFIIALIWIVILVNDKWELHLKKRFAQQGRMGAAALLRPMRRGVDLVVVVVGLLLGLHTFGINPTAALAGLGVGGIAVALAAQKTLENVIGGASLILDEAVRVGDFFKMGDVIGTVEEIGLRSTRIRTVERTLVTIPNGQIANMTLENFSSRDTFLFQHYVGFRYDISTSKVSALIEGISNLLANDSRVVPASVRVRLRRFGSSSLDLETFAYVTAKQWEHFLETQEELLLRIVSFVRSNDVEIAFQSHTVYLESTMTRIASQGVAKEMGPEGIGELAQFQRAAASHGDR